MSLWSSNKKLWKGDLSYLRASMKFLICSIHLGHLVFQIFCFLFQHDFSPFPLSLFLNSPHNNHTYIWIFHLFIMYIISPNADTQSPCHWSDLRVKGSSRKATTLSGCALPYPPKHHHSPRKMRIIILGWRSLKDTTTKCNVWLITESWI